MKNELIEIANKYTLESIVTKLTTLEKHHIDLKIGFLGEFSSGKSTLINALLDQKVLPSMDKPTSKSVVEIYAKEGIEQTLFYKETDQGKESISAIDFSEIALSSSDEKAVLEVSSSAFFQEGYLMIDTPGISSLDQSDMDITYGYLPFLDSAVICTHIHKGSLTQSIIDFLLKEEIRPILNNLLFVITNAHLKAPKAQQNIKEEIITQLETLNKQHALNLEKIREKVIVVSALEAMEQKGDFSLEELQTAFQNLFIQSKERLLKERVDRELHKIADELLNALQFQKENLNLDLSDLRTKEQELDQDTQVLEREKEKILQEFRQLKHKLTEAIHTVLTDYLTRIKTIKNESEIESLMIEMSHAIAEKSNRIVTRHFETVQLSHEQNLFHDLEITLSDILKQIDLGKNLGTVVFIELLTIGTAGVGGALGFFLRGVTKMVRDQRNASSNVKEIATLVDRVNPVEFIGDKISEKLIENKLLPKLEALSERIAQEVNEEIEIQLQKEFFAPLEEKLHTNQILLNQLYQEKSQQSEAFIAYSKGLSDDILELQLLMR